ncbi:MAG: hypothetical protein C5B59_18895 [Bacteroidetes bacterium]|nr:MAG: hypothetical protein C5B59_18895 [Bacteroidota bacterium]
MKNFFIGCIVVAICRLLAAYMIPTFDDAFITFRYGYNFLHGHGLVYNEGEKIMGTTAPLFAIISSVPLMFSISVPKFFVFFNLFCDIGSLYIVFRFFFNRNYQMYFLLVALFAFDPLMQRIAVGGMEANLFLFCSLSGIVLYLNGKKTWAFILLTIIYFLRPEALILLAVLLCYDWYNTKKIPFAYGFLCALVLAIPLGLIYLYYGQFLPQSVVAKSTVGRSSFFYLAKSIFFMNTFSFFVFPLMLFGVLRNINRNKYFLIAGVWAGCYALAYFLRGPFIWTWYIYSIEFVSLIFVSVALTEIFIWMGIEKLGQPFRYYLLPFGILLIWVAGFFHFGRSGVEKNVYAELKKDFSDPVSRKDSVFFADDIGALGYYTKGYVYDDLMLVTPQAADYKSAYQRIIHIQPHYLFLYTDSIYVNMIRKDSLLSKQYTFVKRYSAGGEKEIPADFAKMGKIVYRQDYVLFKRN